MATWDQLVCKSGTFDCNVENQRRCCSKCRFAKCLKQGMKSKFLKVLGQPGKIDGEASGRIIEIDNYEGSSDDLGSSSTSLALSRHSPQSYRSSPVIDSTSSLNVDPNPFDQSLNVAERLLKASLNAYTELLGIDKVKIFFLFFLS